MPKNIEKEFSKLGVSKILNFKKGVKFKKGWRSVVFKVKFNTLSLQPAAGSSQLAALKISTPETIKKEAKLLKLANSIKVGPKFYKSTKHILAMQFISGKTYPEFLKTAKKSQLKKTVLKILKQAYALDSINLNHRQLSKAPKHIIISREKPYIIDFEKGSITKNPNNLCSLLSYLFFNPHNETTKLTRERLNIDLKKIKDYARSYSKSKANAEKAFQLISEALS